MATPNPLAPTKGAGTTLWVYTGTGDPYANPLSDVDWLRLAKIKDLQPGELTAESEDDTYIDDENADWTSTMQGQKSAGETNLTLAWMPEDSGQQDLVNWFDEGTVKGYKIKYPNGVVDVFKGWVSSLGKTISSTRTPRYSTSNSIQVSLTALSRRSPASPAAVLSAFQIPTTLKPALIAVHGPVRLSGHGRITLRGFFTIWLFLTGSASGTV